MKRILVTGALGQIGTELVPALRNLYGSGNILATDIRSSGSRDITEGGPFALLDCRNGERLLSLVKSHQADTIFHLAALLSATAEADPQKAWEVNMEGLRIILEICRQEKCALFTPSSIASFGPSSPKQGTPQDTVQRPTTIYGITKVAGELLCDYYHKKYDVDARGVRYPGIISNAACPGGGTTDYAVHIYYDAVKKGSYTCFLKPDTFLDMLYMPDALKAAVQLMEADPAKLSHRNAFNITAMSLSPETLAQSIREHIPGFKIDYEIDSLRQSIADSWPQSLDDSAARLEWGWKPDYDLKSMTRDMIDTLKAKSLKKAC